MRHLVLFLSFLGGAALIAWGFTLWGYDPLWPLWVVAGFAVIAAVIVSIRRKGREIREDLIAGKDIIARWQLSQADLNAFHAVDRGRAAAGRAYRNIISIPKTAPPEGVPIILGMQNWLIGTRLYHSMPGGTLKCNVAFFDGDPGCIEVATVERSSGAGYFMTVSRLPVPVHARPAGQTAAAALARQVPTPNFERLQRSFPDYLRSLPR